MLSTVNTDSVTLPTSDYWLSKNIARMVHFTTSLVFSYLRNCTLTMAMQQLTDISCPSGPQQQTRCTLLHRANGTGRRTDGQTRYRFVETCPACYAGSVNKHSRWLQTSCLLRRVDLQLTAWQELLKTNPTITHNALQYSLMTLRKKLLSARGSYSSIQWKSAA